MLYGNSIGWNEDSAGGIGVNAIDVGQNNTFDDGISKGNFWSDYNETEIYVISGSAGSVDQYAQLLEDIAIPDIDSPPDMLIDVESIGNTLTWSVHDEFPDSYEIRVNEQPLGGDIEVISIWSGGDITLGLDHLKIGTHSIIIRVYDAVGNTASDEVFVAVVSYLWGGIGTELVMIASGFTVVSFVIIIVLIKKLHK